MLPHYPSFIQFPWFSPINLDRIYWFLGLFLSRSFAYLMESWRDLEDICHGHQSAVNFIVVSSFDLCKSVIKCMLHGQRASQFASHRMTPRARPPNPSMLVDFRFDVGLSTVQHYFINLKSTSLKNI